MRNIAIFSIALLLGACTSTKVYEPVVDLSGVSDLGKYKSDLSECRAYADNVDYSEEKASSAMKGAAVGTGVVAAGAGVVAATGGIVLASVTGPIALVAAGTGALGSSAREGNREQKLRATVYNNCLKKRGYTVLSESDGLAD